MSLPVYSIAALFVVLVAYLVFRLVRYDYLRFGRLRILTTVLQVVVFALHAVLLNYGLPPDWPETDCPLLAAAVGYVIGILGVVIVVAALRVFDSSRHWLGLQSNELKRAGIYRWSRNPQLVGYGLFLVMFLFLWMSWEMVIAFLVYAVIAHIMVLTEEEHLYAVFGEGYRDYCNCTPRYIGLSRRGVGSA